MKNKNKIPLRVKLALKILKKFCESNTICENCVFHTNNTKTYQPAKCDLCYRNPYANYKFYKNK